MSRGESNPSDDDLVFKALASATRRRMLDVLKETHSCTTGDLCERFPDLDRTTVLQHLRVLERAELVVGRKIGRERHLTLAPLPIKHIYDRWIGDYARAAVELLDRLDTNDWDRRLDALDTEVHRTRREQQKPTHHEETA